MAAEGQSYRFRSAIVRLPGRSVAGGLRAVDRGAPVPDTYRLEHAAYVDELRHAGLDVTVLEPLEAFPDSVFVEDAALCLPEGIVILRPGAPSRRGEADAMAADLVSRGFAPVRLVGDGTIEGGDILVTEREILVGASARTNRAGFESLRERLDAWGHDARLVETPPGVLHFKTDCSVLGPDAIFATPRLSSAPCFEDYEVIETPPGEEAAANAIRVNDTVLVPAGYPATLRKLSAAGYDARPVPASQAALLDGGLSCQSLRF